MNNAGLAAMREYLEGSGLVANPRPVELKPTLIIDAGDLVVTLYGTPTPDDKEYFAAMLVAVHGILNQRTEHGTQQVSA